MPSPRKAKSTSRKSAPRKTKSALKSTSEAAPTDRSPKKHRQVHPKAMRDLDGLIRRATQIETELRNASEHLDIKAGEAQMKAIRLIADLLERKHADAEIAELKAAIAELKEAASSRYDDFRESLAATRDAGRSPSAH